MPDSIKKEKKKMRSKVKPAISLIILIIACGTVFYLGWIQIKLPENTYAVLFSKTGGYYEKVLIPGEFNWRWERIFPTYSKLITITLENRYIEVKYLGNLPSGELYSSIIPEQPDFSYNFDFSLSYIINYKKIPTLVAENSINSENIDNWYNAVETGISNDIKRISMEFFTGDNLNLNTGYIDLEKSILESLTTEYKNITFNSFTIEYLNYPDLELYSKSKDIYLTMLANRKESEMKYETQAIEAKINMDTQLEKLTTYGELLTKYPVLIDYFSLNLEDQILDMDMIDSSQLIIRDE